MQDAHTTSSLELGNGVRIEAASIVQELNITMTWLSYPGRSNRTALASEVDFGKPGSVRA